MMPRELTEAQSLVRAFLLAGTAGNNRNFVSQPAQPLAITLPLYAQVIHTVC